MGPKKDKHLVFDDNTWRVLIEEAPLDDEYWKVKVIVIEASGSDQDRIYLNKFETFAAEEKRFVIKNICKTETVFMINQLGSEKKVRDDNLRVFEEGNAYIKEKKDIPPDIYALIIKYLILKMKDEYLFIKRQRLDVKEGMRRESNTMLSKAEVKGTVTNVSLLQPDQAPPDPPPKTDQGPDLPDGKKFNTSLRERGEEWRDKTYVDDYPIDGPNLYVVITGFVEPFLPGCLIKVGIPLTAVVQIRIDPSITNVPAALTRPTKRGQSQTEILADKSMRFWEMLQSLRISEETADDFKNTAFLVFFPPYWEKTELSGEPDKIYDELCFLMYDIQDLSRQHVHYLDNLHIIPVPESTSEEFYEKQYHKLIDRTPLECVTIYSVLDSILTAACAEEALGSSKTSSTSAVAPLSVFNTESSPTNKLMKSENLVKQVFTNLCKTDDCKKEYRLTFGEEYENHKEPIIISYGDFAKYNTFHLGDTNLDNIIFYSLLGMPIHNLWLIQKQPTEEFEAKINYHVNVLLSCFERTDVETAELNRLLHILACRKLYNNRSSLKKLHLPSTTVADFKKVYLKRSVFAKPMPVFPSTSQTTFGIHSYPSMTKVTNETESSQSQKSEMTHDIKLLFECPDISELVSAAEIAKNQPNKHMIDDFENFEDFSGISAFQIICEAFNTFNCVDYKYCEVTDCFILMFFNSHDKEGIARDEWRCHLSTPVCLQDFFDYILEEHYDWILKEELLYDENIIMKAKSSSKDYNKADGLKSCIEDTDIDTDLLMEGSLKQQELLAQGEESSQANTEVMDSSKGQTLSQATTSKKGKSPITIAPTKQTIKVPTPESLESVQIRVKPFLGYDLGDRRVEVFGKDATYFSEDGTKVSSMYSLIIPLNLEYIILSITPGNTHNEFWIHKALGEFVKPDIIAVCDSFRISTKDHVMINVKKQTYETVHLRNSLSGFIPQNETHHYYSLLITWPNGMITESIYEENSETLSHIKQFHVGEKPNVNEEMRCISLNGEVLIFKTTGDVEVLRPDGSLLNITSYHKNLVVREHISKSSDTEDISDKGKKGKEKRGKVKEKLSKTSSKLSKHLNMDNDEKLFSDEPIEYELIIDEFEMIANNGLRQRYVHDIPIDTEKLLIRTATDYCLGEVFSRRMDGTTTLINKDGVFIVTFPNKTRIITSYVIEDTEVYPEWTDEEILDMLSPDIEIIHSMCSVSQSISDTSRKVEEEEVKEKLRSDGYVSINVMYTIEHPNFSTVTVNKCHKHITIDNPNEMRVVIQNDNNYSFVLDNRTTAEFNGENLKVSYEACPECKSYTKCNVKITPTDSDSSLDPYWVKVNDSFCNSVVINDEGDIAMDYTCSEDPVDPPDEFLGHPVEQVEEFEVIGKSMVDGETQNERTTTDVKSESSVMSHGKCRTLYLAKTLRFFVIKRDLTCSELVHRALLEKYKNACRWQPWCSIKTHDTFGDHRSLVSILTPIHLTETEKWLVDSSLVNKPENLTFKDLKTETGKGFYHWMRPYLRFSPTPMKPEKVLPPRLPRAYVLRILEQQWSDEEREVFKGARELLTAILKYRHIMELDCETIMDVPLEDPRNVFEKSIDNAVQNLAHKIYQDLTERLADDVQGRAKANITTTPCPPPPLEPYVDGEYEEHTQETKSVDDREALLKQAEQAEDMSPNLKKYWRRRAEELKEEEFYKYLLREGGVPAYFRNVLGGAIWWEMNSLSGSAVNKAKRRKTRCVCAEENNNNDSTDCGSAFQ